MPEACILPASMDPVSRLETVTVAAPEQPAAGVLAVAQGRRRRGGEEALAHQRIAHAAHAKPAPKAASTTRSPGFTSPASRASASAMGMLAAVVLP